jgi:hypothetical protein
MVEAGESNRARAMKTRKLLKTLDAQLAKHAEEAVRM